MSVDISQETSLVKVISQLLQKHNHPNPNSWEQQVHPDALVVPDKNIQRFLINRYWRQVIGMYPGDTIPVRQCLIDQGSFNDWARLFEDVVIPHILHNLTLH